MTPARRSARSRPAAAMRSAFTLLELLLAMAIAATLSLVLYVSLSTAFQARATAIRQTEGMREAAIALDLIEADLGNATIAGTMDANTGEYAILGPFVGESSGALTFRCLGRSGMANAAGGTRTSGGSSADAAVDPLADGVHEVTYQLTTDATTGTNVLTRSVVRNLLATGTAEAETENLVGGVRTLASRYFDGTDWVDAWDSEVEGDLLPAAVEVTITLDRAGPVGVDGRPRTYEMTRVVPLACADLNALATGGAQ